MGKNRECLLITWFNGLYFRKFFNIPERSTPENTMNYKISKTILLYLLTIILSSSFTNCSAQEDIKSNTTHDYCSIVREKKSTTLSRLLNPFSRLMKNKTGVYVLEEGDVSMIARGWFTRSAEKTIDIQYFIFSADNIGLIASDYLLKAADRGVRIRLLVDDIMVEADAVELIALDAHPNIFIKIYNPVTNVGKNIPQKVYSLASDFDGFNQRMHNKTFTVDGKIVITGGRNIADEYFDYDHRYNFRDRDVLLIGKITEKIQKSFNEFWKAPQSVALSDIIDKSKFEIHTEEKYEELHQYACNPDNFWPQVREKLQSFPEDFQKLNKSGHLVWVDNVDYVSDIPGKNDNENKVGGLSTQALIDLVKNAKESITIQSPYLVTTELSRTLFKEATKRGVEIKILTNSLSSTDNVEAFSGYQRDREALLESGVRIFEFKPDAAVRFKIMTGALQKKLNFAPIFGLHAKSLVIDKKIAVIGTFNLDPRSANLNTECVTVIHSEKVAGELYNVMQVDMQAENAWETTLDWNPDSKAGFWKELRVKMRYIVPKSVL